MRAEARTRMRERILDGAVSAISHLGLEKIGMREVGQAAGVSRGTVYRYFPNRDALLRELAQRESDRLRGRMIEALRGVEGIDRFQVIVRYCAFHVREHQILRQLLDADPAFILRGIRDNYLDLKGTVGDLVLPIIQDLAPIRRGIVSSDEWVDWCTRLLLSAYLFPDPNPEQMSRSLTGVLRMLEEMADKESEGA